MPFDLYAVQKSVIDFLKSEFPQYVFYRNTTPEDEEIPRQGDEVNPFFVVQFGQLYRRPRGRSIKGARNDDYYSWFQIVGVGSVDEDVASALAFIVDRLIGRKFPGAAGLVPDGGPADYGSRQYSVRPVLYYHSQRFEFSLTQNGLDGYLSS